MFCAALDARKKGDAECLSFIRNRASRTPFPDGIWVCGKNATVTRKNDEELSKLEGNIYWSEAEYEGKVTESDRLCDKIFAFKIGARVVMISNDYEEQFYQNGSLGTITGIEGNLIIVELDSGDVIAITFGEKTVTVRVEKALDHALKADASWIEQVVTPDNLSTICQKATVTQ